MTTEESREVAEARKRILDYTNDRWAWLAPRLDDLAEAVRKDSLSRAREAMRVYVETPGIYERDAENWALLQQAVGYEAAPPEGGTEG